MRTLPSRSESLESKTEIQRVGDMNEDVSQSKPHSTIIAPPEAKLPKPKPVERKPSSRRWLWIAILALLAVGAWYLWSKGEASSAAGNAAPAKGGKKGGGGGPVPVVATK